MKNKKCKYNHYDITGISTELGVEPGASDALRDFCPVIVSEQYLHH